MQENTRATVSDEKIADLLTELAELVPQNPQMDLQFLRDHFPLHADILASYLPTLHLVAKLNPTMSGPKGNDSAKRFGNHELQDFELVRLIGYGGMGVVYEAWQKSVGRKVAIKFLAEHAANSERQRQRFENEIRAIARLQHPNIVPIHSVGNVDGQLYFVMQYVDGWTFASIAAANRNLLEFSSPNSTFALPPPGSSEYESFVIQSIAQIAEALEHAHQMGIVHRDIKPSNLMVDRLGHSWLLDFGLATIDSDSNLTQSGELVGTLRYMSPEQVRGEGASAGSQSDVYSLGASLYELLTQKTPFHECGKIQLLHHVREMMPTAPRKINPSIPKDLEKVVLKAMSKEPRDRYTSAEDLRRDLLRFASGQPVLARPLSPLQRIGRRIEKNPIGFLGLAIAVLLMSVSTALSLLFQNESQSQKRINELLNLSVTSMEAKLRSANFIDALSQMRERREQASNGWVWKNLEEAKRASIFCDDESSKTRLRNEVIHSLLAFDMRPAEVLMEDRDVYVAHWSPAGDTIAVGMNSPEEGKGIIELLERGNRASRRTLALPRQKQLNGEPFFEGVRSLLFTKDREQLICGTRSGWLHVFRVRDGELLASEKVHSDYLLSSCWRLQGTQLVTGSRDGYLKVFEFPSLRKIDEVQLDSPVKSIVTIEPRIIVSATTVRSFRLEEEKLVEDQNALNRQTESALDTSSDMQAIGLFSGIELTFAHANSNFLNRRFESVRYDIDNAEEPKGLEHSRDARFQFGWTKAGLFVWDATSGRLVKTHEFAGTAASGISCKPFEERFVLWSDKRAEIFEYRSPPFLRISMPHQSRLRHFDMSENGETMAEVVYDLDPWDENGNECRLVKLTERPSLNLLHFTLQLADSRDQVCMDRLGRRVAFQGQNEEIRILGMSSELVQSTVCSRINHMLRSDSSDHFFVSGEVTLPRTAEGGSSAKPVLECFSFEDASKKWEWQHSDFERTRTPSTFAALSIQQNRLWGACIDQELRVFDADTGHLQSELPLRAGIPSSLLPLANQNQCLVGLQSGELLLCSLDDGSTMKIGPEFDSSIQGMAVVAPNTFVVGVADGELHFLEFKNDQLKALAQMRFPKARLEELKSLRNGKELAIRFRDETAIRFLDIARLRQSLAECGVDW